MTTQTKSLYTMILELENVCIKYYVMLISLAKNGSVEQASCVPGDVKARGGERGGGGGGVTSYIWHSTDVRAE